MTEIGMNATTLEYCRGATPLIKNKKKLENGDIFHGLQLKIYQHFYGRYIKCGERNITKDIWI